eukprot:s5136_g2.t4
MIATVKSTQESQNNGSNGENGSNDKVNSNDDNNRNKKNDDDEDNNKSNTHRMNSSSNNNNDNNNTVDKTAPLINAFWKGELSVETFVGKSSDDLTSEAQRCRRSFEAAEALRAATRRGAEETFRLTCDECSGEAQGSWILSSSGGKPMLGAARMVKRGECTACGHIWLDEGR